MGNALIVDKSRAERVARNEELFQEVNQQIEKLEEKLGQPRTLGILCECSKKHCLETLAVEPTVYKRVRQNPLLFFLVPGHENPEIERVVEQTSEYRVVEKTGHAAEAVRD